MTNAIALSGGPMASERRAPALEPREAVERWLERQRIDKAAATVAGYYGRLKHFWEWCESEGIETMQDLSGWDVDSYQTARRSRDPQPITLRNELITFRQFLQHYANIGVVDESLPDAVELPKVDRQDATDDTLLEEDRALGLLDAYREGPDFGSRCHAFLELAWYTGARMGGIRGLDLSDVDLGERYVSFKHRPEEDTPLKNGHDGQRVVGISEHVVDALRAYIGGERYSVTDYYERKPLFTTTHGRASKTTIRNTSYFGTIPCRYTACPHEKDPKTCEWVSQMEASKCPSSRSPHQIRSGSITWQLNRGVPTDVVAKRVNASVDVIEDFYDKADEVEEFKRRREAHLSKLEDCHGDGEGID